MGLRQISSNSCCSSYIVPMWFPFSTYANTQIDMLCWVFSEGITKAQRKINKGAPMTSAGWLWFSVRKKHFERKLITLHQEPCNAHRDNALQRYFKSFTLHPPYTSFYTTTLSKPLIIWALERCFKRIFKNAHPTSIYTIFEYCFESALQPSVSQRDTRFRV